MTPAKKRRFPSYLLIAIAAVFLFSYGPGLISAQEEEQPSASDTVLQTTTEQGQITEPDTGLSAGMEQNAEDAMTQDEETAAAGEEAKEEKKEIIMVLFGLILFLVVAKLGGDLMERIHQPAVLGELILGVVVGNLVLFGIDTFEFLKHDQFIEILSEIGVIILLFEVGLENNLKEMLSVGTSAFLVATAGVITPFVLGWGVAAAFLPNEPVYIHIFIGATLTATSVGITARVVKDIKKLQTREAKIILGAAVIDDIMGLVVLAIVTGLISAADTGQSINSLSVLFIVVKALAFIILALVVGVKVMPRIFLAALNLKGQGILLAIALVVCFGLAATAEVIGLAGIVGAFAAGVIMEKVHYRGFIDRGEHTLDDLIYPISIFLVPIFFVRMGLMVDLSTFGNMNVLLFATVLTVVAILGKQACSLGVLEKGLNRISVGIGMIPRGEVGLIFAKIGHGMAVAGIPVVSDATYSAVVIMVIITTLVTPPFLKRSLLKKSTDFYATQGS
jgi:Kef-type K+ transport system membrane component KefB